MERTSDVHLRIGVRGNTNTTPNVTRPGDNGGNQAATVTQTATTARPAGGLADTGSPVVIMSSIAIILVVLAAICLLIVKRRKRWGVHQHDRRWQTFLPFGALLIGAISVIGVSVSATPAMNIASSIASADLAIDTHNTPSQAVQNAVQLAANSSTGYALDAKVIKGNLPSSGVELGVSGGDVARPVAVAGGGTRLVTRDHPDSQATVPVTIKATANSTVPNGDYEVTLRFSVKPLPTAESAREVPSVAALMAAPLNPGDFVKTADYTESNDQVRVLYKVVDKLPTDAVLSRVAVPLANGRYAIPQAMNTKLPEANDPQKIEQLMEVAQTYADAGTKLRWDPTRPAPLHTSQVIHKQYQSPYALTCSSFVGMALLAWKYENTTYVANTNKASYSWGTTFARPAGTEPPFQAWKLLAWLHWGDRVAMHKPGTEDYKRGDILFFSKQNPEGQGTGGTYFMNVYHTGIYMGNGKIIHSYSNTTPHGVMVETLSESLKKDLTFVARPKL